VSNDRIETPASVTINAWLPNLVETENAMREWEASTPREYVLRLYKFLNLAATRSWASMLRLSVR
jgi:hypothetical protein